MSKIKIMKNTIKRDTQNEKLYDLSMIEKLCRGDLVKTKKMVELFINDMPISMETIVNAYRNLDYVTLRKTAHKIKPILSMYSIVKIENDIEVIENAGVEENIKPELESKINHLNSVLLQVTHQMNSYIS